MTVKTKASPAWSQFFVERDSLEAKQFQAFLKKESPSCDVVLAADASQAAVLTLRRRGHARVLVILGGLADGRAGDLLKKLRAASDTEPFQWVCLEDRRYCRGAIEERLPEDLEAPLRPHLAEGWMLVRFLEPKRRER